MFFMEYSVKGQIFVPAATPDVIASTAVQSVTNTSNDLAYFDEGNQEIAYKISDIYGSAVRKGRTLPSASIYPNPADGYFMINTGSNGVYRIYDAAGKLVVSAKFSQENTRVNTADLISGVYMVEIITTGKTVREQLFVK